MKIIAISDLHHAIRKIEPIADALRAVDLVILAGDLTNNGSAEHTREVLNAVRQYNTNLLAVPGNWDGRDVRMALDEEKVNIHRAHIMQQEIAFMGVGGGLLAGNSPNEISEADFERYLRQTHETLGAGKPFVLVCHQPPWDTTTDKVWLNHHSGSKSVRAFIEKAQPLLCFTGHVHEAAGIDTIGATRVINPGPLSKGRYAYAEIENGQVTCLEIRPE